MPAQLAKPIRLYKLNPLNGKTKIKARIAAYLLRRKLHKGYVVLLIGPCRTGKSLLVDRMAIETVGGLTTDFRPKDLRHARIPDAPFAIDEIASFECKTFLQELEKLRGRGFTLVAQSHSQLLEYGLCDELRRNHRCIVIEISGRVQMPRSEGREWMTADRPNERLAT